MLRVRCARTRHTNYTSIAHGCSVEFDKGILTTKNLLQILVCPQQNVQVLGMVVRYAAFSTTHLFRNFIEIFCTMNVSQMDDGEK